MNSKAPCAAGYPRSSLLNYPGVRASGALQGDLFQCPPGLLPGSDLSRCDPKQFCAPMLEQGNHKTIGKTAGGAAGRPEQPDQFQRKEVM